MAGSPWLTLRRVAALAAALAVLSQGGRAHADDVVISEEARLHFQAGVALLQDPKAPRYEEAYREFKAAYAASPSYKILSNLGLCAEKIERDKEAIDAFETYLKQAPEVGPEERAQIERDLLTLRTGLVMVTLSSDPPGATLVDVRTPVQGSEVRNAYGEFLAPKDVGLRHGHHTIIAKLQGYLDQQWDFEATGATMPPHVFKMEKPQPAAPGPFHVISIVRERPIPTGAWISGAVTVALAGTGAVLGAVALQKKSEFNDANAVGDKSGAQNAKDSGQVFNVATDAVFGAAIIGAAVTTFLWVTRPTVERPTSVPSALLPHTVGPVWMPGGGGASAAWVF
jgi:hypothetical protein